MHETSYSLSSIHDICYSFTEENFVTNLSFDVHNPGGRRKIINRTPPPPRKHSYNSIVGSASFSKTENKEGPHLYEPC